MLLPPTFLLQYSICTLFRRQIPKTRSLLNGQIKLSVSTFRLTLRVFSEKLFCILAGLETVCVTPFYGQPQTPIGWVGVDRESRFWLVRPAAKRVVPLNSMLKLVRPDCSESRQCAVTIILNMEGEREIAGCAMKQCKLLLRFCQITVEKCTKRSDIMDIVINRYYY